MLDARDLTIVRTISMPGSVLGMHWDAQLNQIFVAAGGSLPPSAHLPVLFRLQAMQMICSAGVHSCRGVQLLHLRAWKASVLHFLCSSLSQLQLQWLSLKRCLMLQHCKLCALRELLWQSHVDAANLGGQDLSLFDVLACWRAWLLPGCWCSQSRLPHAHSHCRRQQDWSCTCVVRPEPEQQRGAAECCTKATACQSLRLPGENVLCDHLAPTLK